MLHTEVLSILASPIPVSDRVVSAVLALSPKLETLTAHRP
jgi:hypothetical protein